MQSLRLCIQHCGASLVDVGVIPFKRKAFGLETRASMNDDGSAG